MHVLLLAAVVAAGAFTLAGCAEDRALDAGQLEREVARLYPPDEPTTRVRVRCEHGLGASEGSTSDCLVRVGPDRATVRATVTEVGDDGPEFEAPPVVPAERLAREVLRSLEGQEYAVGEVVCIGDLVGRRGETVLCTAEPPGEGRRTLVEASVVSARGLDVQVEYRSLG